MRDPHVVSLIYFVDAADAVSFENAPPLRASIDGFRLHLGGGTLEVEPTQHYSSTGAARAHVEPLLRAWELDVALHSGNTELSFPFRDAKVVDRNPIPGALAELMLAGSFRVGAEIQATLTVRRAKYPDPPAFFRVSPDVETLWHRYTGYKQGREPLPAMAYFCLTFLQGIAHGRTKAGEALKIAPEVLSKTRRTVVNPRRPYQCSKVPRQATWRPRNRLDREDTPVDHQEGRRAAC